MALEPGVGWRFLRQPGYGVAAQVALQAVGVDHEDDPGAPVVDDAGDAPARGVSSP